jgi:hypothetical protein
MQCDVTGATRILRISWDETWHMMARAVARGQLRKEPEIVRHIGLDEKAIAKEHRYLTVVSNLDKGTVEHIIMGYVSEAVDRVRKEEHRALIAESGVCRDQADGTQCCAGLGNERSAATALGL